MKRIRFALTAVIFTMLLTCTAFAANSKEVRNKTAQFLMEKSNAAMEEVKSFKMDGWMDLDMVIDVDGYTDEQCVQMSIEALAELPGKIYVKYGMATDYGIFDSFELYLNEDGMYTRIPGMTEGWEYSEESAEMYAMMSEIIAGGADYTKIIAEKYPELAEMEALINSNLDYSKNAVIDGNEYYVVSMDLDLSLLIGSIKDYMKDIYAEQESYMYEGYADDALASFNLILDNLEANLTSDMYICKTDYMLEFMKLNLDMNISLSELLGGDIAFVMDFLVNYSDFNASLDFPQM